MRACNLRSSN